MRARRLKQGRRLGGAVVRDVRRRPDGSAVLRVECLRNTDVALAKFRIEGQGWTYAFTRDDEAPYGMMYFVET